MKKSWHYNLIVNKFGLRPKTVPGYWFAGILLSMAYLIPFMILGILVILVGVAGMDITGGWFASVFYDWIAGFIVGAVILCAGVVAIISSIYVVGTIMDIMRKLIMSGKLKFFEFKRMKYE